MSKFVRLNKTVNSKGILVPIQEIHKHIKDNTIDHYTSVYNYNDNHFKLFEETGSIAGFKDVKTNKIWFDFDNETNPQEARKDAIELIKRLEKYVKTDTLEIYFSGKKGFNVILNLTKELNRKQVETFAKRTAKGLKTFDPAIYDEARLLRVPGTKHQDSGYYKIPLTFEELKTLSGDEIRQRASKPLTPKEACPISHLNTLDDHLFEVEEPKIQPKALLTTELDLSNKPRQWKSSKWALMQGFFGSGERDTSMMILAATCKAMGYDENTTYYMCKSALKKSWKRYGEGDFKKEDLWKKIEQVYSSTWNGGQYSEKNDLYLQKKAEELGIKELITSSTTDIKGSLRIFKDYAKNINNLTLKTGIEEIDKRQRITVGMSIGVIAAPGVGKTSIALQMLHSMSKSGELCMFFSYDMYAPLVVQKIIQKHWYENNVDEVFQKYEANDQEYVSRVEELIEKEYPNVEFCFDSAQSIEDIYTSIRDTEQKRGKKCKFIVIDYNELVITDISDPTQSSNYVAQKVREIASKEQVCVMSLFQPSKMTGDPSIEILSFRAAKGGSGIEQSVSLMFGVSRPGFDPRKPEDDKYISINCVKNRMGSIFSVDLSWNGYKGEVRSLTNQEKSQLKMLRQRKEDEKNGKKMGLNEGWDDNF